MALVSRMIMQTNIMQKYGKKKEKAKKPLNNRRKNTSYFILSNMWLLIMGIMMLFQISTIN